MDLKPQYRSGDIEVFDSDDQEALSVVHRLLSLLWVLLAVIIVFVAGSAVGGYVMAGAMSSEIDRLFVCEARK